MAELNKIATYVAQKLQKELFEITYMVQTTLTVKLCSLKSTWARKNIFAAVKRPLVTYKIPEKCTKNKIIKIK